MRFFSKKDSQTDKDAAAKVFEEMQKQQQTAMQQMAAMQKQQTEALTQSLTALTEVVGAVNAPPPEAPMTAEDLQGAMEDPDRFAHLVQRVSGTTEPPKPAMDEEVIKNMIAEAVETTSAEQMFKTQYPQLAQHMEYVNYLGGKMAPEGTPEERAKIVAAEAAKHLNINLERPAFPGGHGAASASTGSSPAKEKPTDFFSSLMEVGKQYNGMEE